MNRFDPSRRKVLATALASPAAMLAAGAAGAGPGTIATAVPAAAVSASRSTSVQQKADHVMRKYQVGDQKGLESLQLVDGPVA